MRPCAATGCTATYTESVWTKQGRLDACVHHQAVLREAGELTDGPPSKVDIVTEPDADKRAKILAGVAASKAAGVRNGRPPVRVPAEALAAVHAGEPVKTVAKRMGIEPNTLRRRASGAVVADDVPSGRTVSAVVDEMRAASVRITAGEAKLREAERMIEEARTALAALNAELAGLL